MHPETKSGAWTRHILTNQGLRAGLSTFKNTDSQCKTRHLFVVSNSITMLSTLGRASSTDSSHILDQSAAGCKYLELEDASRRKDTYNIVIYGQSGAGKSSLINLITKKQVARTSPDAEGCTRQTTVYGYDVVTENRTLKVQLFDTAGLDEGAQGTVPNPQAEHALKRLFQTHMKIHIIVYCVQGVKNAPALRRNYDLLSRFKRNVPVVLVVTGLEDREPEMEEWWKRNQASISYSGMDFAGHACITALTINACDTDKVRQRREQSYHAVCNLIEQNCPIKNIVLFGASGAGKSSVVNLMAGENVAETSPSMERCTLRWKEYFIDFDGESYKVFDTVGLEEPDLGIKDYLMSVENAYHLVKELHKQGGIDLLLFCIRAGRVTATLSSNYRLFYEFLCEKKVPIVLAITNLEREQRMEDWWEREHHIFARYQIHVAGHACITAADGLQAGTQMAVRYEESRVAIRQLVKKHVADGQLQAWMGGDNLFVSLMRRLKELLRGNSHVRRKDLVRHLTKRCGISLNVAKQLADRIKRD
ncbi:P-loop containing nucleoside triphosphate hydrolase protein [Suillus discolor]|uniref:P-loop containing nucleoside triphosphate hydrolase protein n=1 Tax=Suillus discolor TaxID=1912936 RepID=A0A9P7JM67_9AGAM|nr:P-loop containing nucleoside triphosphate hydrolase protein [Suillus discolor]KAG2088664.1 P-loop containing nucleoside triphosphate hydrolase protein [Suillus discolor]